MFDNLTDENISLYQLKCYETPKCIMSEYENDVKHIKYVKRLFKKYKQNSELKERLILNHIILLSNVFGAQATTRILFFHLDEEYYSFLKTFLLYLSYLPDIVTGIRGLNIDTKFISTDTMILKRLENI